MDMIDKTKLSVEELGQLENWEANKKQLLVLEDLADISQEVLNVLDSNKKDGSTSTKQLGALLVDIRDSLKVLQQKEAPDIPDYAKPVVEALNKVEGKLSASIRSLEVKPEFRPEITVDAPGVTVDLKGVEKVLKGDVAQAFKDAIKLIPQTEIPEADYSPLLSALKNMSEQLESIDTATRMKPLPGTIRVSNLDEISSTASVYESYTDTTTDTNLVYLGKADPGTATSASSWQIKRYNKSTGHMSFADDETTFSKEWDDRTTYSY